MTYVLNIQNGICVSKSINYVNSIYNNEIEVTEEQYNQMNEFPLKLTLDENGKVVEWEKTTIEPDPIEIQKQLEQSKIEKITQSKQQLHEFLESNPLEYNNELYSVTQEKQSLLTSAIAAYQLRVQAGVPAELKWNTTGDICREFTLEEITGLVVAITEYVQPRVEKQQALEVAINNCTTIEELDNIVIDYEVV
jgi:hypothetical protein